jgi:hypothetical protein
MYALSMSDSRGDAEIPKKAEVYNLIEIVLNLKEAEKQCR